MSKVFREWNIVPTAWSLIPRLVVHAVEEHVKVIGRARADEIAFSLSRETVFACGSQSGELGARRPDGEDGVEGFAEFQRAPDGYAAVFGNERPAGAGDGVNIGSEHSGDCEQCGEGTRDLHRVEGIKAVRPRQARARLRSKSSPIFVPFESCHLPVSPRTGLALTQATLTRLPGGAIKAT